jgi:hypothetical protein
MRAYSGGTVKPRQRMSATSSRAWRSARMWSLFTGRKVEGAGAPRPVRGSCGGESRRAEGLGRRSARPEPASHPPISRRWSPGRVHPARLGHDMRVRSSHDMPMRPAVARQGRGHHAHVRPGRSPACARWRHGSPCSPLAAWHPWPACRGLAGTRCCTPPSVPTSTGGCAPPSQASRRLPPRARPADPGHCFLLPSRRTVLLLARRSHMGYGLGCDDRVEDGSILHHGPTASWRAGRPTSFLRGVLLFVQDATDRRGAGHHPKVCIGVES